MENFQSVLILVSGVTICGVLGHGIWTIRKQKELAKQRVEKQQEDGSDDQFTAHKKSEPSLDLDINLGDMDSPNQRQEPKISLEPTMNIDSGLSMGQGFEANSMETAADHADVKVTVTDANATAVNATDANTSEMAPNRTSVTESMQKPESDNKAHSVVLVLHICGKDQQMIDGAALLPIVLEQHFKYGEMEIFHRHQEPSGNGTVLFSMANMMNPGTFDIDNMEQFSTQGVALFMTATDQESARQHFAQMWRTASYIAQELDAELLDSQRQPMSSASEQYYADQINTLPEKPLAGNNAA